MHSSEISYHTKGDNLVIGGQDFPEKDGFSVGVGVLATISPVPGWRAFKTAMALNDDMRLSFVAEVDHSLVLWIVKVQVVESHRVQDTSNKTGYAHTRHFKRYILVDEQGTKVSGVVYDDDIQYYSTSLQPLKRYLISNFKLLPGYGFFKIGPYDFSWIITNETPVELVDEPIVPPLPFNYDVCPFNQFVHHADKES